MVLAPGFLLLVFSFARSAQNALWSVKQAEQKSQAAVMEERITRITGAGGPSGGRREPGFERITNLRVQTIHQHVCRQQLVKFDPPFNRWFKCKKARAIPNEGRTQEQSVAEGSIYADACARIGSITGGASMGCLYSEGLCSSLSQEYFDGLGHVYIMKIRELAEQLKLGQIFSFADAFHDVVYKMSIYLDSVADLGGRSVYCHQRKYIKSGAKFRKAYERKRQSFFSDHMECWEVPSLNQWFNLHPLLLARIQHNKPPRCPKVWQVASGSGAKTNKMLEVDAWETTLEQAQANYWHANITRPSCGFLEGHSLAVHVRLGDLVSVGSKLQLLLILIHI
jgi:hypothetical protein